MDNICPCCGKVEVEPFCICSICGWQNDTYQKNNPKAKKCANRMSLEEAKQAYAEGRKVY